MKIPPIEPPRRSTGQEGSNPESFGGFNKLLKNLLIDNGVLNPMNAFLFEDVTPEALRPVGGQRACGWLDADNDGDLDFFVGVWDGEGTGSGGSVYITCASFGGSGAVRANGGVGTRSDVGGGSGGAAGMGGSAPP